MKKITSAVLLFLSIILMNSCVKEETPYEPASEPVSEPAIQGQVGNPRFNLQFDNETNVDLDLHVLTPSGKEIYYDNPTADGGSLDVDCLCDLCPTGPNENIYWTAGTALAGTYKFWVEYYDNCGVAGSPSNFTLRLMKNAEVLQTYKGVLSSAGSTSLIYSINFQ